MPTDEPQLLIDALIQAGFEELDRSVVDGILARGAECVPLLLGLLRHADEPVVARALALLGEIGDPPVLHDIFPFFPEDDEEDAVTDSAAWAFHRMAIRHPAETLRIIAELAATADPWELSDLGQHLSMMPEVPGRVETLLRFAERLPEFDSHGKALAVSNMIITAMFLDGPRGELAASIRQDHGAHLNREALKLIKDVEGELARHPYVPDEAAESSVYEIACGGFTTEEEGGTQVRAEPKLGRNDPCWCGSGKKYKKCHLAADEAR